MATGLSALHSLEFLYLHFLSRPALESPPLPPPTCSILPSLTNIKFNGASEYLEEILAVIDTPRLGPTLWAMEKGCIAFNPKIIIVRFSSQTSVYRDDVLIVEITCMAFGRQLSTLKHVFTSSLPTVSTLKDLYILENPLSQLRWQDDVENTPWLELLHPFAAEESLPK